MIRDIVFDIGWVFVALDPRPMLDFLHEHGGPKMELDALVAQVVLSDHETGLLPGAGLLERLQKLLTRPAALEDLRAKWLDMFDPQHDMMALARGLASGYGVYLLSNIGDLHWEHLGRTYAVDRIGHGALPSFLAGVMKPHDAIYAQAEQRFGLHPASTVFVDDRRENIEAARARGWHGIIHRSFAETCQALARLGVELPA